MKNRYGIFKVIKDKMLSQKQIRERTGIPRSTLSWLLNRLEIMPVETRRSLFGREFFIYDDSCIDLINKWLNSQLQRKNLQQEHFGKVRCMGGCRKWYNKTDMFSVYCKPCYVKKSIMTLISHGCKVGQTDPLLITLTKEFVSKL